MGLSADAWRYVLVFVGTMTALRMSLTAALFWRRVLRRREELETAGILGIGVSMPIRWTAVCIVAVWGLVVTSAIGAYYAAAHHFPANPLIPPVILFDLMLYAGVDRWGLHLFGNIERRLDHPEN